MPSPPRFVHRFAASCTFGAFFGLSLAAATGCEPRGGECVEGTRGCACAADESCVGELECLSAVCVGPDADDGDTATAATTGDDAESDTGGHADDDANDDADNNAEDDAAPDAGAPEVCERLLACLAEVSPDAVPEALDAYGPDSECWRDPSLTEVCVSACASSLANRSASGHPQCQECATAEDCGPFAGSHCVLGLCVECTNDSECPNDRPTCTNAGGRLTCTATVCGEGEAACSNGLCLPLGYFCDGYPDCPTGDDELNC